MLFDIYRDWNSSQWEINGSLMTSTVTLDEYLCLFFVKKNDLRRTAELKLFEFLVSLRYYVKQWPRAAMFALLSNIT
jgi:hypothetical protein